MASLAEQRVDELKREFYGRFVYHDRFLWSIAVILKSDAWLRGLDYPVMSTR